MGVMLRITPTAHTSTQLRALSIKCSDGAQVCRMLALAMVLAARVAPLRQSAVPSASSSRSVR